MVYPLEYGLEFGISDCRSGCDSNEDFMPSLSLLIVWLTEFGNTVVLLLLRG